MNVQLFSQHLNSADNSLFSMLCKVKQLGPLANAPATMAFWVLWDAYDPQKGI